MWTWAWRRGWRLGGGEYKVEGVVEVQLIVTDTPTS